MLNLNKLTKDLNFDNIDEVIGGRRGIYAHAVLRCKDYYTSSSSCSSSSGNCGGGGDENDGNNNGNSGD